MQDSLSDTLLKALKPLLCLAKLEIGWLEGGSSVNKLPPQLQQLTLKLSRGSRCTVLLNLVTGECVVCQPWVMHH